MTDAKVSWLKEIQFTGSAAGVSELPLGSNQDDFRPMELFAVGMAGCTAMDVISILQKKRQDVTAFEVRVHADRAEDHPKVFTQAQIEYRVAGHSIDESAVLRSIELSATRYCPAYAMFEKIIPILLVYSIYEDLGDGERKLLYSGSYTPNMQLA